MFDLLHKLHEKDKHNKKTGDNSCMDCPLVRDHDGPVFIEHEGKSQPKIIIISESPAGFEKINYNYLKLDEWKKSIILSEIRNFGQWDKIGQMNTLSKFLACLTDNRMVTKPENLTTINDIYWTHAVKCFIQQKSESIKDAKKRLGKNFDKACKYCAKYLCEEVKIVKPDIIITIGSVAFNAVSSDDSVKKKDIIGKSIKFHDAELVYTYHPNARMSRRVKEEGFNYAKERIKSYLKVS